MSGDQKTIINGKVSQYVKLNVGGRLYYTTIATLTAKKDTMLQAMFSGRMEVLTDSEGMHLQRSRLIFRSIRGGWMSDALITEHIWIALCHLYCN